MSLNNETDVSRFIIQFEQLGQAVAALEANAIDHMPHLVATLQNAMDLVNSNPSAVWTLCW